MSWWGRRGVKIGGGRGRTNRSLSNSRCNPAGVTAIPDIEIRKTKLLRGNKSRELYSYIIKNQKLQSPAWTDLDTLNEVLPRKVIRETWELKTVVLPIYQLPRYIHLNSWKDAYNLWRVSFKKIRIVYVVSSTALGEGLASIALMRRWLLELLTRLPKTNEAGLSPW